MRWRKVKCVIVSVIYAWFVAISSLWAFWLWKMTEGGYLLLSESNPNIAWTEFFLAVIGAFYALGKLVKMIKDTFFPSPVQK